MALAKVGKRYYSLQDIYNEVDTILGVDVSEYQKERIKKLFRKYTFHIVIPEVTEIIKIMYEGDIKKIGSDIISAKFAGVEQK